MMNSGYRIEDEDIGFLKGEADSWSSVMKTNCRSFKAPKEIDPRKWHRIENQGRIGACQGFSLSSCAEMAYRIKTKKVIQLSPIFAYLESQRYDGLLGSDDGSTITSGVKCAREKGICEESVMPYPNPVKYSTGIPAGAAENASKFKVLSHIWLETYEDVFNFLSQGLGGVHTGKTWYNGYKPNREGLIESYDVNARGGGHSVPYLGYSQRTDLRGRKYLWLPNSWDTDWGIDGWAEVAPAAVDSELRGRNNVAVGLSDMTAPTPRDVPVWEDGGLA